WSSATRSCQTARVWSAQPGTRCWYPRYTN
ncbi:MAG: hypothetical protein AVDCRST_MAG14-1924, partial [uncultured Rubrobacteraceae bacterium]